MMFTLILTREAAPGCHSMPEPMPGSVYMCTPESVYLCTPESVYMCTPESVYMCTPEYVYMCTPEYVYMCTPEYVYMCTPEYVYMCMQESVYMCIARVWLFSHYFFQIYTLYMLCMLTNHARTTQYYDNVWCVISVLVLMRLDVCDAK